MRESLRARLLLWHVATGVLIIALFGASVCYLVWHTRLSTIDADLASRAALLRDAVRPTDDGQVDLILGPSLRQQGPANAYHFIWTRDGVLIDRSDADVQTPDTGTPGLRFHDGHRELISTAAAGVVVLVGFDLAGVRSDVWSLAIALTLLGFSILLLSVGAGWWFVGRALEPLDRINRTARRMSDGDLAARIPEDRVDTEAGQIVRALNSTFDQLHGAVERQRRFTADASHELRTPLTTLSTEVQWALSRPRTNEELTSSLEVAARAAGRMQSVIERLLFLARGEALAVRTIPVRVDEIARQAAEHVEALSYAAGLTMKIDTQPSTIQADPERLLEATTNVLTNAVRYNVPGGRVDLTVKRVDGHVELAIADTGIGIGALDLPHVFDAFFRGDPARSRDTGGAGLGLAVARSVVEHHGGTIACESAPGEGTTIRMRWPESSSRQNP
jgi:signal transduction histidine kinase